jgi:DNA polymerase I-like protein with 3'-5' exonuclease and polymerase domains
MKPLIIDLETSIGSGVHGSDFRDPNNDYYTLIYGTKPDNIKVVHNKDGWKRGLNDELKQLLLECDVIVGHNLTFDLSYMFKNQELIDFFIRGGKVWDCQVGEYILTAQQHQYASLSELQSKYLGQNQKISRISQLFKAGYGADKIVQAKNRCARVFELYNKYCLSDGESTLKVFKSQYIRSKQEGMLEIISLYQDYLVALITATCSGIPIDVNACEKTLTEFNLKHLEYLAEAEKLVSKVWTNDRLPAFNINSNDHKSAVLFGGEIRNMIRTNVGKYKHGGDKFKMVEHKIWVDGWRLSKNLTKESKKSGVYVTDNAVMASIALNTTNDNVKKYCELQKEAMMYKKAANTYVKAFLDRNVNGLLHPNFNNVATATGRLSSSAPNLQNVSKRNKFGKTLHNLFIAPAGWKCVQIDFCLVPTTKVLTDEFIWKPIGDVKVGETLIGFDEHTRNHEGRRWKPSQVLKTKVIKKECLRITTSEGVITCSKDHMFLATSSGQSTLNWVKASDLDLKSTMTKVMEVWDTPENNETGWGAGFLDGEGYISNSSQIGFGQNNDGHNKLCFDKMCALFDKYLINTENRTSSQSRCHKVRPAGMRTGWQAVGVFQPIRLKQKLKEQYQNTSIRSKKNRKVRILSIEDVGVMDVVAMETSTHTFLAEGFLSHNCQLEIFVMAWLSGDETLKHHLLTGVDMHCVRLGYYIDKSYDELVKLCKTDKVDEWVKQRSSAKTVSYQMAYGAMPPKVAESTGLPLEIVEKIYEQEAVTYPRTVQLGNIVMESVKNSATFSLSKNIPGAQKKGINGSKFKNGIELLPIFDIGGNIGYNMEYMRKVGYWKSPTGKKYHFLQNGKMYKGMIKSGFSFTQPKNYPMQGCAADIQGATTAALLNILLKHSDKIKLINEIHDSKLFLIKEEYLDRMLPKIVDVIEDVPKIFKERFGIDVPFKFPVDVEVGDNFGDMNPYQK